MSYKNRVKASEFLRWYFSDSMDERDIAYRVISELKANGKVTLSVDSLFDGCGYIPQHICEDGWGTSEYDPSEVLFVDDLGKEVTNG